MSIPALLRLREAKPEAHIALLTADKLADLWRNHPAINQIISFTRQQGIGQVSKELRANQFATALIFPNSFRSAFESWLAGIPTRIGYADCGRSLLLTRLVAPRREHIVM